MRRLAGSRLGSNLGAVFSALIVQQGDLVAGWAGLCFFLWPRQLLVAVSRTQHRRCLNKLTVLGRPHLGPVADIDLQPQTRAAFPRIPFPILTCIVEYRA